MGTSPEGGASDKALKPQVSHKYDDPPHDSLPQASRGGAGSALPTLRGDGELKRSDPNPSAGWMPCSRGHAPATSTRGGWGAPHTWKLCGARRAWLPKSPRLTAVRFIRAVSMSFIVPKLQVNGEEEMWMQVAVM